VNKKARNRGKPPPKQPPGSRAKCSTERLHSPCSPVSRDWAAARCVSKEDLLPACHPTPPLRSCARTNQTKKEEETRRNQDTGKAAKSWRAASLPFPSPARDRDSRRRSTSYLLCCGRDMWLAQQCLLAARRRGDWRRGRRGAESVAAVFAAVARRVL
jgi:hypothetical protein